MNQINSHPFGDTTAENDHAMLHSAFIETPDFRTLIEADDRTIVVGRRGTGKSALFIRLQKHWAFNKKILVLSFSPEDTEIIGFRSILSPFSSSFNLARAATKILWKYAMLMEIASYLNSHYKLSSKIKSNILLSKHVNEWGDMRGDILRKCRLKANIFLDKKNIESSIGDLQYNLDISELEMSIFELLSNIDKKVIILMDKLDEGYEPDNIGIGIIAGFAYAVIDLNQRTDNIRPIIFLRDNIFRALSKEDPDYSRNIEGQVIRLHWDWSQLLKLATQRMRVSFDNDKEKDQKVWDFYTADELKGRSGFKKCLQFTLYRPRDLLSLLNESFYSAFRDNRNNIIHDDLEFAAKTISISRLEDLWKEYNKIFPSIQFITSLFRNNEPQLTISSCLDIISNYDQMPEIQNNSEALSEINLLGYSGILQSLYSVGFIGISENNSSSFAFCHDGRTPDKGFKDDDRVLIHPCYWIALNLSQKILSPEEAETINDEYDINIVSSNPEIRNKRIGQIVSDLQKISLGQEGASEFENWCVDALNIIFASHLADIRKHPNKNSVQRRDIVGANMGTSAFWNRVLTDYKVRQVIFEAKNYQSLDGDVYRQLQSYLTAQYGKLAFIINRENTEELTGKNLDWMKEMYNSHNVLILKMPTSFIIKLLQKIRSPNKHDVIDQQMNKLLNVYERLYISNKSTVRKK